MHTLTTDLRTSGASRWSLAPLAVVAGVSAAFVWGVIGVVLLVALLPAAFAAGVDARTGRIPDRLVFGSAVPPLAVIAYELGGGHGVAPVVSVVLGAVAFGGPLLAAHLVAPNALGFGDVKLAAALGLSIGIVDPRLGLVALCVASFVGAAFGLTVGRRSVPLGPGLVLGAAVTLVAAERLGGAPLPWR